MVWYQCSVYVHNVICHIIMFICPPKLYGPELKIILIRARCRHAVASEVICGRTFRGTFLRRIFTLGTRTVGGARRCRHIPKTPSEELTTRGLRNDSPRRFAHVPADPRGSDPCGISYIVTDYYNNAVSSVLDRE